MSLSSRFQASSFLSRQVDLSSFNIETLEGLSAEDLATKCHSVCTSLSSLPIDFTSLEQNLSSPNVVEALEQAEKALLQAKVDFVVLWSTAELGDSLSQPELGRLQTSFAEATISYALKLAWLRLAMKHKPIAKVVIDLKACVPGMFIFGMGKLGGYDLNFSSDVDLIAYFDAEVLPVPDVLGKSYICHQVLQGLTRLLAQGGASNFIWRVDWRLRPNASAMSLAMSVNAAEDYYFYQASPWHRLALMKARVVAGDLDLGNAFIEKLRPFIWRQNLDYRALDELAEIKQRINLEHPSLRAQRQWSDPISEQINGFNVKLGSGGIREIEFIANALQLLWGGRHRRLRTPNTLTALSELASLSKLALDDAKLLSEAYQFLRELENAIQMQGNQHTHLIPNADDLQQQLGILLGLKDWSSFIKQLNQYREFVHDYFCGLFAEQEAAQGGVLIWPDDLSAQADDIVDSWERGFVNYGVSTQVRHRLRPLSRGLADYLSDQEFDASDTVLRLHDFFRSLPSGEQYFRLLAESPLLLSSIVPPLMHSPAMTLLLKQSPHIIDCYIHQPWSYPEPFDSEYVLHETDYGEQLELMRRFVNEHLYQLYLSFLNGVLDANTFQSALTDLAKHSLDLAIEIVANNMQLTSSPITVIGMGKVALGRMSPLSDLDLIFVFDHENTSLELASRFVARLQTAIAAPMREGILYELDTRLRPSGRSGAPTVSIESFANHHLKQAHTWEHIALVPSQVVAGNRATEAKLNQIKSSLIRQQRDALQLSYDAQKMWQRIAEHRVKAVSVDIMFSKLREGGLMQAEYLAACEVLTHGHSLTADSPEFDVLLAQIDSNSQLSEIIQFWRIQQLWERLLGNTDQPVNSIPKPYLELLLKQSGVSTLEELLEKKEKYASFVEQRMQQLFIEYETSAEELDSWQETGVQWAQLSG